VLAQIWRSRVRGQMSHHNGGHIIRCLIILVYDKVIDSQPCGLQNLVAYARNKQESLWNSGCCHRVEGSANLSISPVVPSHRKRGCWIECSVDALLGRARSRAIGLASDRPPTRTQAAGNFVNVTLDFNPDHSVLPYLRPVAVL